MMTKDETLRFVREHRGDDVRTLALQTRRDSGIDLPWALDQIQGWQTACRKLPSWAAVDGIIYPPHLSMEQCSSEETANYKCGIIGHLPQHCRGLLVDLTGGFGVDFAFMAKCFDMALYVENQKHLCEIAQHNFRLLGLEHARILHAEAEAALSELETDPSATIIYLDPARRDSNKARTYAIADCSPDVSALLPRLIHAGHHVLIKLSPMLDWHKAVSDMGSRVAQVHIVSVDNECKELLLLLSTDHEGEPAIHCVNDGQSLVFTPSLNEDSPDIAADGAGAFLYEPNASIMKAGCFGVLTRRYPVKALAPDSHLFVSGKDIEDFPGRRFSVDAVTSMNKKELANALKGLTHANVATRNFPMTAQELRKRLHLADGGDTYIFGTTTADGQRRLFICRKMSK